MKPAEIVQRFDELDARKGTLKAHLQEVADFMCPVKATVTTAGTLGAKRGSRIFDGTALRAVRTFANGLYGHLTSPAAPWFELTVKDKALARRPDVKRWLRETSERMHDALNSSNFGLAIHEVYTDLGWAGTGPIYCGEGKRNILAFSTFSVGRVCVMENEDGLVDTVFRLERMTARKIVRRWPDTASEKIRKAAEKNPGQIFDVIHAVFPREDIERFFDRSAGILRPKRGSRNLPFASFYVEREGKNVLSESGYHEMPYMVPRWTKDSEEEYGRSPGMDALADVKMLNEMSKTDIKAMQKIADPPLVAPHEMALTPMRLTPGGINYYKPGAEPKPLYVPDKIRINLEYEEQRRRAIESNFFVDLFTMLAAAPRQMTATEVLERAEEKLTLLGPALGRLQSELYDPLLSRVFWIMYRAGYIDPVPRVLVGAGLEVEYISKLAMAMRIFEVRAVEKGLAFAAQVAAAKPDVMDNFDLDKAAVGISRRHGVPEEFIRPERERDDLRQQRAAAEEKARLEAGMEKVAGAVPLEKKVEQGSVLDMIMQGVSGNA